MLRSLNSYDACYWGIFTGEKHFQTERNVIFIQSLTACLTSGTVSRCPSLGAARLPEIRRAVRSNISPTGNETQDFRELIQHGKYLKTKEKNVFTILKTLFFFLLWTLPFPSLKEWKDRKGTIKCSGMLRATYEPFYIHLYLNFGPLKAPDICWIILCQHQSLRNTKIPVNLRPFPGNRRKIGRGKRGGLGSLILMILDVR